MPKKCDKGKIVSFQTKILEVTMQMPKRLSTDVSGSGYRFCRFPEGWAYCLTLYVAMTFFFFTWVRTLSSVHRPSRTRRQAERVAPQIHMQTPYDRLPHTQSEGSRRTENTRRRVGSIRSAVECWGSVGVFFVAREPNMRPFPYSVGGNSSFPEDTSGNGHRGSKTSAERNGLDLDTKEGAGS